MLTSVAISCGVSLRSRPPLPAYGPSVPSRTTTMSISGRVRERAAHAGVEPGGAQVHVVVEFEAQAQQQAALEDSAGHRRVADRAEQDRVVLAQLGPSTDSGSNSPVACQRAAPRS